MLIIYLASHLLSNILLYFLYFAKIQNKILFNERTILLHKQDLKNRFLLAKSTGLLLTQKSIFSERKKDSTTKVKRKGFISDSRALLSSLEEINKCFFESFMSKKNYGLSCKKKLR